MTADHADVVRALQEFGLTFGSQYGPTDVPHPTWAGATADGWVTILAPDEVRARACAVRLFDTAWSHLYTDDDGDTSERGLRKFFPLGELARFHHDDAELPAAAESQPVDVDAIADRWSTGGGMGTARSAADYTDAGCRVLAGQAFRDVNGLLDRLRDVDALLAAVLGQHSDKGTGFCRCGHLLRQCPTRRAAATTRGRS